LSVGVAGPYLGGIQVTRTAIFPRAVDGQDAASTCREDTKPVSGTATGFPMQDGRYFLRCLTRASTAPNGLFNGLIWPKDGWRLDRP
jgi:hypothetical protein